MNKRAFAHSKEERPEKEWQRLCAHLSGVGEQAAEFARGAGANDSAFVEAARWAGLLHDIGKYTPEFQAYLRRERRGGTDTHHAIFGARVAADRTMLGPAFATAGHHAGLHDSGDLQAAKEDPKYDLENRLPGVLLRFESALFQVPDQVAEPAYVRGRLLGAEYYIRMLFSCLVDADYLDTEQACRDRLRHPVLLPAVLDDLIMRTLKEKDSKSPVGPLNEMRHAIFDRCLKAASARLGFFTLTVPTGGGKTLSAMAFALAHAKAHELRRIIVVIPYLSIIEQNAAEYRRFLDPKDQGIVVEHHSASAPCCDEDCDRSASEMTAELAAENWDAPVVVTTSVQFIESLFANRPSACRKLHNIARSVVVLDEVQTLPMHLLTPLLSVLRELQEHYGVSFVFSTATQPAFRASSSLPDGFKPGEVVEIAGEKTRVAESFRALNRVHYERVGTLDWPSVAKHMAREPRILCIVNTRKHAFDLWEALRDIVHVDDRDSVFHLSSALCAEHRLDMIGAMQSPRRGSIRERLLAGLPCRVVSTQVVEAGVDLDFPVVLRAMAPLDSIVQAAGRCNREAGADKGLVVVFQPQDGGLPSGAYKTATAHTVAFLANRDLSQVASEPILLAEYFSGLFGISDTDHTRKKECTIQEDREALRFREVARKARVIADDTVSIVTPYGKGKEVINDIRERTRPADVPRFDRHDRRRLQRYAVSLRRHDYFLLEVNRAITPLLPNLDVHVLDAACYHSHLGVIVNKLPTEELCGV